MESVEGCSEGQTARQRDMHLHLCECNLSHAYHSMHHFRDEDECNGAHEKCTHRHEEASIAIDGQIA